MNQETLLGFDIGEKKIGIALANSFLKNARPLEIIFSRRRRVQIEAIDKLLEEWQPERVIVGISLLFSDKVKNENNKRSYYFANFFKKIRKIQVELIDEDYSSYEAQEILKNNKADDAIAACIILQRYLDKISN